MESNAATSSMVLAHFPLPAGADPEQVEGLVLGLMGYGILSTDSLWKSAENLFGVMYEMGDRTGYQKFTQVPALDPEELGTLYRDELIYAETHSHAECISETPHFEICELSSCYFHGFELATPCQLTACQFQSDQANMGCGYNARSVDPSVLEFEVIAHRLEIDVEDARQDYHTAIRKLRASYFGRSGTIQPHWDTVSISGLCSICASDCAEEETCCSECSTRYSGYGTALILSYQRELKDILQEVAKKYDLYKMQAEILNITTGTLQNLYLAVGIPRRCTVVAANEYEATHPRPGKFIPMYGQEYIASGVFSARQVFGDFTESTMSRIAELHKRVRSFGFESQSAFTLEG